MSEIPPPTLAYANVDPKWFVEWSVREGGVMELRDREWSLGAVLISKWRYPLIAIATPLVTANIVYRMQRGMYINDLYPIAALLAIAACIFGQAWEIYLRLRQPSVVRIEGGRLMLTRPAWSQEPARMWDLREVESVESVIGSSRSHSFRSIMVRFRNDTKVTFLHCRSGREANWIAMHIRARVDEAKANVMQVA